MHKHWVGAAALGLLASLSCGAALRADDGDAAGLVGKTCQGVFNNGKHQLVSRGALQLQLANQGGQIVGHFWRAFGKEAYEQAEYAMTQHHLIGLAGFQDLGAVRGLVVDGKTLRFSDAIGVKFELSRTAAGLYGTGDPRGGSDPRMKVPATVSLICP